MIFYHFLLFYALSWFILTGIFKYSTNQKYFLYTMPVLVAFGCFAGFILDTLKLNDFFIWYVGLVIATLAATFLNKKKELLRVKGPGGYEETNWLSVSLKKTLKYFVFSSLLYVLSFVICYLYLLNYR